MVTDGHLFIGNNLGDARVVAEGATGFSKGLRIGCPGSGDALPGTSNRFVKLSAWSAQRFSSMTRQ